MCGLEREFLPLQVHLKKFGKFQNKQFDTLLWQVKNRIKKYGLQNKFIIFFKIVLQ